MTLFGLAAAMPGRALMVFLAWSAGESLLRALDPDFTTSLDTLRRGRLGPRAGAGPSPRPRLRAPCSPGLRLALYALAVAGAGRLAGGGER